MPDGLFDDAKRLPEYGKFYSLVQRNTPQVRALRWIKRGSRVLEIGCGHAGVTRLLKTELDCETVAVDNDERCGRAVAPYARRFVCGDLSTDETIEAIRGEYDYVVLFDVLEHLACPDLALRRLREAVGSNARFVITVPNVLVWHVRLQMLFGRFDYTDTGTLDRTHLRFFTPHSAGKLVEDCGLVIDVRDRTWHLPLLGSIASAVQLADLEDAPQRAERRFGTAAKPAIAGIMMLRKLNAYGLTVGLDASGRLASRLFPVLFTNHAILVAHPPGAAL